MTGLELRPDFGTEGRETRNRWDLAAGSATVRDVHRSRSGPLSGPVDKSTG
jgi:hypothetical protein